MQLIAISMHHRRLGQAVKSETKKANCWQKCFQKSSLVTPGGISVCAKDMSRQKKTPQKHPAIWVGNETLEEFSTVLRINMQHWRTVNREFFLNVHKTMNQECVFKQAEISAAALIHRQQIIAGSLVCRTFCGWRWSGSCSKAHGDGLGLKMAATLPAAWYVRREELNIKHIIYIYIYVSQLLWIDYCT